MPAVTRIEAQVEGAREAQFLADSMRSIEATTRTLNPVLRDFGRFAKGAGRGIRVMDRAALKFKRTMNELSQGSIQLNRSLDIFSKKNPLGRQVATAEDLNASLRETQDLLKRINSASRGSSTRQSGRRLSEGQRRYNRQLGRTTSHLNRIDRAFKFLRRTAILAFSGFAVAHFVEGLARGADEVTNIRNLIAAAGNAAERLPEHMAEVRRIAFETFTPLEGAGRLYARILRSSDRLGLSMRQSVLITEAFQQSLALSGADAREMLSSSIQFGQALSSGRLAGDELKSILESNSFFTQRLADAYGEINSIDISLNEFKELGAQGKLTSDTLSQLTLRVVPRINEAFGRFNRTFQHAFNNFRTGIGLMLNDLGNFLDETFGIRDAILRLADDLDEVFGSEGSAFDTLTLGDVTGAIKAFFGNAADALQVSLGRINFDRVTTGLVGSLTGIGDTIRVFIRRFFDNLATVASQITPGRIDAVVDAVVQGVRSAMERLDQSFNDSLSGVAFTRQLVGVGLSIYLGYLQTLGTVIIEGAFLFGRFLFDQYQRLSTRLERYLHQDRIDERTASTQRAIRDAGAQPGTLAGAHGSAQILLDELSARGRDFFFRDGQQIDNLSRTAILLADATNGLAEATRLSSEPILADSFGAEIAGAQAQLTSNTDLLFNQLRQLVDVLSDTGLTEDFSESVRSAIGDTLASALDQIGSGDVQGAASTVDSVLAQLQRVFSISDPGQASELEGLRAFIQDGLAVNKRLATNLTNLTAASDLDFDARVSEVRAQRAADLIAAQERYTAAVDLSTRVLEQTNLSDREGFDNDARIVNQDEAFDQARDKTREYFGDTFDIVEGFIDDVLDAALVDGDTARAALADISEASRRQAQFRQAQRFIDIERATQQREEAKLIKQRLLNAEIPQDLPGADTRGFFARLLDFTNQDDFTDVGEAMRQNVTRSIANALNTGQGLAEVGKSILAALAGALNDRLAENLVSIFDPLFNSITDALTGDTASQAFEQIGAFLSSALQGILSGIGGAAGGIGGFLGSLFSGTPAAHEGARVGRESLIRVLPEETIRTPAQERSLQRRLTGGNSGGTTINIPITGDVDQATLRAIFNNAAEVNAILSRGAA